MAVKEWLEFLQTSFLPFFFPSFLPSLSHSTSTLTQASTRFLKKGQGECINKIYEQQRKFMEYTFHHGILSYVKQHLQKTAYLLLFLPFASSFPSFRRDGPPRKPLAVVVLAVSDFHGPSTSAAFSSLASCSWNLTKTVILQMFSSVQ